MMPIAKDKKRTGFVLPITLIEQLQRFAEFDGRSLNNLVVKVLSDYAESRKTEIKMADFLERLKEEDRENKRKQST